MRCRWCADDERGDPLAVPGRRRHLTPRYPMTQWPRPPRRWPLGTTPPGVPHLTPSHGADARCSLPTNTLASMMVGGCGCHGAHHDQVGTRCHRGAPCPLRAPQPMHAPCLYVHEGRWCWCLSVGHSAVYDRLSVCHEGRWCWCLTWCGVLAGSWGVWVAPSRWSMVRSIDVELVDVESMGRSINVELVDVDRWVGQLVGATLGRWCVSAW